MMDNVKYKIRIINYRGEEWSMTFPNIDPGIDDWIHQFKSILYWLTFFPGDIEEYLGEKELRVDKAKIEEIAVSIASDHGDVAFPNLIPIVKYVLSEIGVEYE